MIGSICFQHGDDFVGKTIQRVSDFRFTHVFIIVDKDKNGYKILDTDWRQSHIRYLDYYKNDKLDIFQPTENLSNDVIKEATKNIVKQYRGKQYGYLQLVGYLPVIWFSKLFKKKIKNPFTKNITCVEKTYDYCDFVNMCEVRLYDKNSITPEQLYRIVMTSPKFEKVQVIQT